MAVSIGAQVGVLLPYSRIQESEADVLGLQLMAMAGFNPEQSIVLWQNMAQATGKNKQSELLSTHPSDQHRIDRAESASGQLPLVAPKAKELGRKPQCQF